MLAKLLAICIKQERKIDFQKALIYPFSHKTRILLDNSSGKKQRFVWLGALELSQQRSTSLIGLRAFSGNDYVSSFFKKGKAQFWKLREKFEKFHDCFSNLGVQYEMSEELFKQLEEFVCYLYGMRIKYVNEVRWRLFEKKHKRENKIADLSSRPPCQEVLRYHCQRANYVAYIWRHSFQPMIHLEDVENHGWFRSGGLFWFNIAFPDMSKICCVWTSKMTKMIVNVRSSTEVKSRVKIVVMKLINY